MGISYGFLLTLWLFSISLDSIFIFSFSINMEFKRPRLEFFSAKNESGKKKYI